MTCLLEFKDKDFKAVVFGDVKEIMLKMNEMIGILSRKIGILKEELNRNSGMEKSYIYII